MTTALLWMFSGVVIAFEVMMLRDLWIAIAQWPGERAVRVRDLPQLAALRDPAPGEVIDVSVHGADSAVVVSQCFPTRSAAQAALAEIWAAAGGRYVFIFENSRGRLVTGAPAGRWRLWAPRRRQNARMPNNVVTAEIAKA